MLNCRDCTEKYLFRVFFASTDTQSHVVGAEAIPAERAFPAEHPFPAAAFRLGEGRQGDITREFKLEAAWRRSAACRMPRLRKIWVLHWVKCFEADPQIRSPAMDR
jgi:hypothetical protein